MPYARVMAQLNYLVHNVHSAMELGLLVKPQKVIWNLIFANAFSLIEKNVHYVEKTVTMILPTNQKF